MPSVQDFAPHFKRFVDWVLPEMLYEQHCLQYFDIAWRQPENTSKQFSIAEG